MFEFLFLVAVAVTPAATLTGLAWLAIYLTSDL